MDGSFSKLGDIRVEANRVSTQEISVRSATIFDASAILLLGRRAFDELQAKGVPIFPEDSGLLSTLADVVNNRFCFLAIDKRSGKAVGCIGAVPLRQWWSPKWTLQQAFWYVVPKHRKTRAGRMLMQALLIRAKEAGLPLFMFSLDGGANEQVMRRFMRGMGFTAIGGSYVASTIEMGN